jgi:hypothetical protein
MYISDDHRKMLADVLPPGVDPLPMPETKFEAFELLLLLICSDVRKAERSDAESSRA